MKFVKTIIILAIIIAFSSCNADNIEPTGESYPLSALVKNISASSQLKEEKTPLFSYHPTNIYDYNAKTAWFEGVKGNGEGEYLEMQFFTPINIHSINISNGYAKSASLFTNNGSVKELLIEANNQAITLKLKQTSTPQSHALKLENVSTIRLTIKSTYPGKKYSDTGISELSLNNSLATSVARSVNVQDVLSIYKAYKSGVSRGREIDSLILNLTPEQLTSLLSYKFDSKLDGDLNDDRLLQFINSVNIKPVLIPAFLNAALQLDNSIFQTSASAGDPYVEIANIIWKDSASGIPFVKSKMTENYPAQYFLLKHGDTRNVDDYLELFKSTGVEQDFCCELMPSEILSLNGDSRTLKKIGLFVENNELEEPVTKELQKAYMSLSDKLYD